VRRSVRDCHVPATSRDDLAWGRTPCIGHVQSGQPTIIPYGCAPRSELAQCRSDDEQQSKAADDDSDCPASDGKLA